VKNSRKKISFVFKQIPIEEDFASQHLITTKETQTETICSKLQIGVCEKEGFYD
jgi:hypothetical protein